MKRLCLLVTIAAGALAAAPGAAVAAPVELLTNGSFESGFSGWTTTQPTVPLYPWTIASSSTPVVFTLATPQDGTFDAANGFDGSPGAYTLTQQVTIPPGTDSALSWLDRLQYFMFGGAQARIMEVRILDGSSATLATPYSFTTGPGDFQLHDTGWQSHSVDLSSFAGQTVSVQFHFDIPENFSGPAQAELDALSLLATFRVPATKDDCKNGGWTRYYNEDSTPRFTNQGDCVSFVASGN